MPYNCLNTVGRDRRPSGSVVVQRLRARRVHIWVLALLLAIVGLPWSAGDVRAQSESGPRLGDDSERSLDFGTGGGTPAPPQPAEAPRANPAPVAPSAGNRAAAPEITPHRDWDVACAPGGGNCIMTQEGTDADGNTALRIMIERLEEPQEVEDQVVVAVIDIVTPLGVVLNVGLSFQVDESPTSRAPFQICTTEGCLVREPVTQEVIDRMRRGNAATIGFVVANYGEIESELSLSGFTSAYRSLAP